MHIFFISDLHLGHSNIITFTGDDGERIRPFDSVDDMHNTMISRWNSVVRPSDHVYILGDVVIGKKDLPLLNEFNGHKRIVLGNHDPYAAQDYLQYVDKIFGVRVMNGAVLTHVPIHPASLNQRTWNFNIHGHLHQREVLGIDGLRDPRYFNVSCERLDYYPIERDQLRDELISRGLPVSKDLKFL
jgi:calcineurin-like phosphoesterase family protein